MMFKAKKSRVNSRHTSINVSSSNLRMKMRRSQQLGNLKSMSGSPASSPARLCLSPVTSGRGKISIMGSLIFTFTFAGDAGRAPSRFFMPRSSPPATSGTLPRSSAIGHRSLLARHPPEFSRTDYRNASTRPAGSADTRTGSGSGTSTPYRDSSGRLPGTETTSRHSSGSLIHHRTRRLRGCNRKQFRQQPIHGRSPRASSADRGEEVGSLNPLGMSEENR